jgi:hypothetical protein
MIRNGNSFSTALSGRACPEFEVSLGVFLCEPLAIYYLFLKTLLKLFWPNIAIFTYLRAKLCFALELLILEAPIG